MHAVSSRASWQEFRLIRQHYRSIPEGSLGSLQRSSEKLVDTQTIFVGRSLIFSLIVIQIFFYLMDL